ncbi:MAG TPA: RNA methyltransferase [Jatrophihabitans sp.]
MPVIEVSDAADPRLDDFRDLQDADARPDRRGVVIAEGVNVVERLIGSPYRVRAIFGVPARLAALAPVLPEDVPAYAADKWLLSEVVGFRVTRGVLAAADRLAGPDVPALLARSSRVAVLESLNDFENLGALFRNAAAFGLDAVLLDPQCADPLYRRSVRVSMGHVLRVPFARLPGQWPSSLRMVKDAGLNLLAMTPSGDLEVSSSELGSLLDNRGRRWAVLFGAEGPGLTAEAMAVADARVRIPMAAGVDSLNVATAAAVAFSHLA